MSKVDGSSYLGTSARVLVAPVLEGFMTDDTKRRRNKIMMKTLIPRSDDEDEGRGIRGEQQVRLLTSGIQQAYTEYISAPAENTQRHRFWVRSSSLGTKYQEWRKQVDSLVQGVITNLKVNGHDTQNVEYAIVDYKSREWIEDEDCTLLLTIKPTRRHQNNGKLQFLAKVDDPRDDYEHPHEDTIRSWRFADRVDSLLEEKTEILHALVRGTLPSVKATIILLDACREVRKEDGMSQVKFGVVDGETFTTRAGAEYHPNQPSGSSGVVGYGLRFEAYESVPGVVGSAI